MNGGQPTGIVPAEIFVLILCLYYRMNNIATTDDFVLCLIIYLVGVSLIILSP